VLHLVLSVYSWPSWWSVDWNTLSQINQIHKCCVWWKPVTIFYLVMLLGTFALVQQNVTTQRCTSLGTKLFWRGAHFGDWHWWSREGAVVAGSRLRLKCDGTHAETRFRLSAQWTSPFQSVGGRQFSRLLAAEVCASAVVMLDTPRSEVVWRVLATHCIRQFPLHFPSRSSPCAITFQLDCTTVIHSCCNVQRPAV